MPSGHFGYCFLYRWSHHVLLCTMWLSHLHCAYAILRPLATRVSFRWGQEGSLRPTSWHMSVYSASGKTYLSGVGLHVDPSSTEWNVPLDAGTHWRSVDTRYQQTQSIPTMKQWPSNGLHGYLIHDACWELLTQFMSPRSVPQDRLLQLLLSLPLPLRYGGVSWGHDYGGLAFYDVRNTYPWEDHFRMEFIDSSICNDAKSNPLDIPSSSWSLSPDQRQTMLSTLASWTQDCFAVFPWELRELIAALLLTTAVLNLRLASRSFLGMLDSQRFWLSRFESTGDRGFLFEAIKERKPQDWRAVWRAMINPTAPGMRNRKRIWNIIQTVADLMDLVIASEKQLPPDIYLSRNQTTKSVAADIRHGPQNGHFAAFNEGCTIHGCHRISIPSQLSSLVVNTIEVGGHRYICGIRLTDGEGSCATLGYASNAHVSSLHTASVSGFEVAMGSRGLRALRIRSLGGTWSQWLGDPIDTPITRRLDTESCFDMLEAGYDVHWVLCSLVRVHWQRLFVSGIQDRVSTAYTKCFVTGFTSKTITVITSPCALVPKCPTASPDAEWAFVYWQDFSGHGV